MALTFLSRKLNVINFFSQNNFIFPKLLNINCLLFNIELQNMIFLKKDNQSETEKGNKPKINMINPYKNTINKDKNSVGSSKLYHTLIHFCILP